MSWSRTLFTIRGIDIKVHLTFLLIVLFGAVEWGSRHGARGALFGVAFTLALFFCVLLHELGHSLVARALGVKVREIVLLPIGGVARLDESPKSPKHEILIAAAGPLVSVLIAAALYLATPGAALKSTLELATGGGLPPSGTTFLALLTVSNVSLALFNSLPFFPLDGGRVLRAVLSLRVGELRATKWASTVGHVGAIAMAGWALMTGQLLLILIALVVFVSASHERSRAVLSAPLQRITAGELAEIPAIELDGLTRVKDAIPQLLRSQQDAFPVVGDGALVGVVLRSDLVAAAHAPHLRLQSIRSLAVPCPSIPAHLSAARAVEILNELEAPFGVVTTPDYPVGLISAPQVMLKLSLIPAGYEEELRPHAARGDATPRNAA